MDGVTTSAPLGHGRARVARALLVAVVTVGVSIGAHALCGGALPGTAPLAALLAATAGATWVVSRTQWTTPRLAALMSAVEVATHLAAGAGHATHAVDAMSSLSMATGSHPMAATGAAGSAHALSTAMPMSGLSMLLAHVVAGALSVAYLRSGEHALWRLVATWAVRLLAVPGAPAAPPRLPHSPVLGLARRPVVRLAVVRVGSRAPPLALV